MSDERPTVTFCTYEQCADAEVPCPRCTTIFADEFKIEAVTRLRARNDPYTSSAPKVNGGGAVLVPISTARVRWLERPEIYPELILNAKKSDPQP